MTRASGDARARRRSMDSRARRRIDEWLVVLDDIARRSTLAVEIEDVAMPRSDGEIRAVATHRCGARAREGRANDGGDGLTERKGCVKANRRS